MFSPIASGKAQDIVWWDCGSHRDIVIPVYIQCNKKFAHMSVRLELLSICVIRELSNHTELNISANLLEVYKTMF